MIIDQNNQYFPEGLKQIKDAPKQIYVQGNLEILNNKGIAVVGSRKCTTYGVKICQKFVEELIKYKINIVSGMAVGIDSIAHKTAIKFGANTIAVLPCGFNKIYPKQNKELMNDILKTGGAIITEYSQNTEATSDKFLRRNALVSGLSIGTLIIEAGYRSGTSVTARLTKEQGKKVFCIPSSLENAKGVGTNRLIQKGAKLVTCVEEILKEYPEIKWKKDNIINKEKQYFEDNNLKDVYKCLSNEPIFAEEIANWLQIGIQEVNYKLMLLEIQNKVRVLPGRRYVINE